MQTSTHSVVQLDAATQLDRSRSSSLAAFTQNSPLDRPKPCSSVSAISAGFTCVTSATARTRTASPSPLSLLLIRTCSPMLAALPAIPSSRLSVPHMWEHTLYAQPLAPRGVQVPRIAGTHNSTGSCLRTDADLFSKPKAVILPMVNFWATQVQRSRPHCHSR